MEQDDADSTLMRRPPAEAAAEEPLLHLLLLHSPDAPPRRIPLGPAPLRIGRVAGNELVLAAPEVSRRHAEVTLAGQVATLADLGSTNGCLVDGARIAGPVALAPGAGIDRAELVLEEQALNALRHGGAPAVELQLGREEEGWVLRLEDAGLAFDPTGEAPPPAAAAEGKGGLGLALVRRTARALRYARVAGGRNRVEVVLPPE